MAEIRTQTPDTPVYSQKRALSKLDVLYYGEKSNGTDLLGVFRAEFGLSEMKN